MAFAFPSVGVNTGALRPGVLQRISLFRTGAAGTQSMELSPIVKVPTRQGFYHYFAENDALPGGDFSTVSATGAQSIQAVDYDTPASPGGLRITSAAYQASIYRWGFNVFTLKQIDEFAARGEDITARYADKLSIQGRQHHAAITGYALRQSANYGSSTAVTDGGIASAQLQKTFNNLLLASAADGCDIEGGRWVATCNLTTANRLLGKNEVFQMGYGIASDAAGTAQFRAGASDMTQLKAFFASRLIVPLDLVILPTYLPTNASQTGVSVLTDGDVSIFKVAEAYGDSGFLQTFTPDPNAALGQIYSYDTNNPKGIAMHVESDYGVVVLGGTANKWARLATGISA